MDNELVDILNDTIAMQKQNNKRILILIYVKKKTLSYIADTYGYSESTIKNKHRRALKIIASMA